ncbi:MAG: amidohydrolase [Gemmatimonas sp.]
MFALRVVTRTDGVPAPTRNDWCATPRRRGAYLPLLVALGLMPVRLGAQESSPDLIVTDAKVFTADSTRLWAEAFAVRRDRIIAVGTTIEMRALAGARTRRVNAGGRVVIPGINDAHVHLGEGSLGLTFGTRDTTPAGPTLQEVLDSLRQIAPRTPKGTWLQASLGQRILFDPLARRAALDVVSPDHPVLLRAPWGHGIVVNSAALRALGIADTASDLLGGRYERDADRRLTGMLVEYDGWAPIQRAQARQRQRDAVAAVRRDVLGRLEFGVTSVQDMASTWDAPSTQRILREAALPVRVRVVRWPMPGAGGRQLRRWSDLPVQVAPMVSVSGVKYVLEGTPQEQGALNRTAYAGRPGWFGELNFPLDTIRAMLREALAGSDVRDQLLLHVVGDSTVVVLLTMMESLAPDSVWRTKRVRFEHASRLTGPLVARAHALGIIVAQPRSSAAYRTWLTAGIPVAYGSDGQPNPFIDFAAAVTMSNRPAEAISREAAAIILTRGSAVAEWSEASKGTIAPGMLADFAILSQDIFTAPAAALPSTRSVLTVVGGRVVHASGALVVPR